MEKPKGSNSPNKLTLAEFLRMLLSAGKIDKSHAETLYKGRKLDTSNLHPIIIVAEQKWDDLLTEKTMTPDSLSRWLATATSHEFFHIDPLKLDFSSASQMVSKAYAQRLKIMPISINGDEAVVATADPYQTDWVPELERMLSMKIQLVVANPLEINRYLPEVYNLASTINKAALSKADQIVGVQNFEQLVELGKGKNLDANEQHVVNIVDWLFKYAFEQRASDIHLEPRRDMGTLPFRIDGVLHQVYQLPTTIMNAITSRIKLLGRMNMVEKRRPQDVSY